MGLVVWSTIRTEGKTEMAAKTVEQAEAALQRGAAAFVSKGKFARVVAENMAMIRQGAGVIINTSRKVDGLVEGAPSQVTEGP